MKEHRAFAGTGFCEQLADAFDHLRAAIGLDDCIQGRSITAVFDDLRVVFAGPRLHHLRPSMHTSCGACLDPVDLLKQERNGSGLSREYGVQKTELRARSQVFRTQG
jgi:hypothetical protein